MSVRIISSVPVIRVSDYPLARAFYAGVLGFRCVEEGGEPPRFGVFRRDAATILVDAWHGADERPSPGWRAYLRVTDVDALAASLPQGAVAEGPRDTGYGMREVVVADPDGNRLCFGQDA